MPVYSDAVKQVLETIPLVDQLTKVAEQRASGLLTADELVHCLINVLVDNKIKLSSGEPSE